MSEISMLSSGTPAASAMPSPSQSGTDSGRAMSYEFHSSLSEEERRFYLKAYPTVDVVRERKTHCTVCKIHIGTAPSQEEFIKMHPILRVTHCNKCHDFYNSGEFSKGEDGSELYCRWCGQGGEVYCCSSCPYVFCKSCIVKNLSRGVVSDIEQNENWNCFSCAPKILWPLRAQHWALMNYLDQQKREICAMNLNELELKHNLSKDRSKCCRLAKSKCGNMSDSMESLDSLTSKRSHGSTGSAKKQLKSYSSPSPQPKRQKTNDEVVCTPDLLSMLEPDCQITVTPKPTQQQRPQHSPSASTPKVMCIQPAASIYGGGSPQLVGMQKSSVPPPLVLRNTAVKVRTVAPPPPIVRRTVIGPRTPSPGGAGAPVYHTINGYRIDLNSAAQQETFRLPNGKLIQVKRQGAPPTGNAQQPQTTNWQITTPQQQQQQQQQQRVVPQTIASRPVQITQHTYPTMQQQLQGQNPQVVRYNNVIGSTTITHNGTPMQVINGQVTGPAPPVQAQQQAVAQQSNVPMRPVMIRHVFGDTPIGHARTGLQEQVFNAMEICTHLTNKVQTLTNSNAYKQAKNYLEVKELYIHLSYLLTYAIGRFKGLQDKCLADMRQLGFVNDADSLENGQLAAAVDYVCYGQLDDVDLFDMGKNSFHNQVYEYRKSLHANMKDGEDGAKSPLPPIFQLGQASKMADDKDDKIESKVIDDEDDSLLEEPRKPFRCRQWLETGENSRLENYAQENEENEEPDDSFLDANDSLRPTANTEAAMRKEEEAAFYDRKLTRLVAQYPAIWCTRHADYGNFEVTKRQWLTIASHFDPYENIKLRWKNIRKRFVRIEKRIAEGKKYNGHFDKAMAFLANRDLPTERWVVVDCGEEDGDTYEEATCNFAAIEESLQRQGKDALIYKEAAIDRERERERLERYTFQPAFKPMDISSIDLRIMSFVKNNPVLWTKSMDPEADKIDEITRKTVWEQMHKTIPEISLDFIKDRWQFLYEMYKTFRLKTIKSPGDCANLELKYSKYLAKLYFLYKIDEEELRNENNGIFEDCFELEEDEETEEDDEQEEKDGAQVKLQDMPDDKEFLEKLVEQVKAYPAIWNTQHSDYNDIMIRDNYWQEINEKLFEFKHKQASDDEDNEIQIVEPKTDLINLDSDEEDDQPPSKKPNVEQPKQPSLLKLNSRPQIQIKPVERLINKPPVSVATNTNTVPIKPVESIAEISLETMALDFLSGPGKDREPNADDIDHMDFMATSFLASFLEVDIEEGTSSSSSSAQKKQPRKKLTNKPNPTLIRQKEMMQRERLEEMKRNDLKLKMQCSIALKRVENDVPRAKELLKALLKKREEETKPQNTDKPEDKTEDNISEKDMLEVEIILEENDDEVLNSSGTVVLLDDSDVNETEEDKPKKIEAEKSTNGNSNDKEKLNESKDNDKEKPIASDKTIDKETVKEKAANSEESSAKTTEKETVEEQQQQKEEKSATKSSKEVINLDSTLDDEDDVEEVKQKSPENKTKISEENSMEIDDEKVKDKSPEKNDEVTDEPMEVDDDTKVEEKNSENTKVKENQKPAIDNDDVEVYKKIDEILQDGANKSTNDEIPKSDDNTEEKIETKELAQSNKQQNVEVMDSSETASEKKEDELNKEEEVMESSLCSDTEKKLSDDESEEKKKELDSNATIPNTLDSNDSSKSIGEQVEKLAVEVKDKEDEAEEIKADEDEDEEIKVNEDQAEEVKSNEDKVEEDEAEEDKAKDDIAKEDKAKDDKANEDKAKEDITEKDESEEDKTEQDKAEEDETQEDVTEEDETKEHSAVTVNGIETNAIENVDKHIETEAIEKTIAEDAPKTPAPQIPTESDNSSTTNTSSSSTAAEPDKDNSTVATT